VSLHLRRVPPGAALALQLDQREPADRREPQRLTLRRPPTPRPCGEITSGSGGCRSGPYHAGKIRYACRSRPSWAMYEIFVTRTAAAVAGGSAEATPASNAARTKRKGGPHGRAPRLFHFSRNVIRASGRCHYSQRTLNRKTTKARQSPRVLGSDQASSASAIAPRTPARAPSDGAVMYSEIRSRTTVESR
jgi:hypothetical protein